jgi:outer membrane protein assembly factor BamC
MKSLVRVGVAGSLTALVLSGCGGSLFQKDKEIDYKTKGANTSQSPLEVPPDLTAPMRDDRFSVPSTSSNKGSTTFSTYSAERQTSKSTSNEVLPSADNSKFRMERVGNERWLVVEGSTQSVWQQLRGFWQDTGFVLRIDSPEIGIMETEWAENRAKVPQGGLRNLLGSIADGLYSTPERDKFRTRVEQSNEPGKVEIYISHRGMYEVYTQERTNETRWQPRPTDPDLEAEMLRRVMVRLGATEESSKQLVAEKPQQSDRARLANGGDGVLQLTVLDQLDRAWRQVGLTLDRVGLVVEDRDRAKGIYFVRYVASDLPEDANKESWLSKLAFWRGKKEAGTDQFRIVVTAAGDQTLVRLQNKDGAAAPAESARQILGLLYNELK